MEKPVETEEVFEEASDDIENQNAEASANPEVNEY